MQFSLSWVAEAKKGAKKKERKKEEGDSHLNCFLQR